MSSPQSTRPQQPNRPTLEQVQAFKREALEQANREWSPEELETLSRLLREKDFQLFSRYLLPLWHKLETEVWQAHSWDEYLFMRGQHDTLVRIARLGEEIEEIRKVRKGEQTP